jgi:capsular polysaccharide biosynthesis protein
MPEPAVPEVREVTLADIVRTLWARKWVLLAVFLLTVGAGTAYTFLQAPKYTARATLVTIEQQDVIQRWLESRPAAEWVAQRLGDPLLSEVFPGDWSEASGTWKGQAPGPQRQGAAVAGLVDVQVVPPVSGRVDRTLRVVVTFTDAALAADVANAYVDSLAVIRPQLQNVTESALFAQFYDGQNAADARRQAHEVALERQYWIALDPAYTPADPSSPNVPLNLALSVVLGLLLGIVAALTASWLASYRVSSRPPDVPKAPEAASPNAGFKYRGGGR